MTELMHFQPGKALYDAYQQGRGNYLAGQAFNSQGDQRQSALGQLAGLNPDKAMALKADFDEQDKADFTEFSNVILNAPEDLKPQIYAKGVQRFGHKIRALGVEPPADYKQAMPLFQQLSQASGKGKYTGAPIIVRGEDGKDYYARYSDKGIEQTNFRPSDSYTYDTDGAGNVWRGARRGGDYGPAPLEGAKQPPAQPSMPQVQAGADPMAGGLDRINQGVQVLKSKGVPVEKINEWADNEFAKLQGSVQGGVVEQAPAQAPPSQAKVAVKTEAPKPKEAPSGYAYKPDGSLAPIPGGPADPANKAADGGKLTDDMRKTSTLLSRMDFALNQIRDVEATDKSANRPGYGVAAIDYLPDALGNDLKSSGRQQIESAQLDALDAALTLATGAAYTKEQLFGLRKAYFPQPNDSEATIKAKQARFENVIQSARVRAGNAAQAPIKPAGGAKGAPQVGDVVKGYRYKGGNPADPKSWEKQ